MEKRKAAGLSLTIIVILISFCIPGNTYLDVKGIRTVGVLVSFLIMLVTEALPVVVTSLVYCGLMPLLGITENLAEALSGYSQPIVFFTLASFGIAAALTEIPLSQRILRKLLEMFGQGIESVLLAMMVACAVFSSIVSNVPTCAIFMAISLDFLKLYEDETDRRKTGRAFMIAIPIASMIGGMMTPAGSSINLIAISQLEIYTGADVSFIQWMVAGIPMSLVLIPLAWWLAIKIYKPVPVMKEKIQQFINKMSEDIPEKLDVQEKKVMVIVGSTLILWITSSWISQINVMVVAILGCGLMFFPKVEVLNVDTFLRENSWDAFFLVGTVLSISGAMIRNGVSDCIAGLIPVMNVSPQLLNAFVAVLIFASLIVIPVATSLLPILAATLITVALNAGASPALIMMTAAFCACNCYLLPLDTVPLITYSKGYYSMTDMAKSTIFLQITVVLLSAVWLPVLGGIVGLV